jgi:protein phosphatase
MQLALEYYLMRDRGMLRERNEDRCGVFVAKDQATRVERGHLFVVADGVGGHGGGDVAAEIALDSIQRTYFAGGWHGPDDALRAAFIAAHRAILARAGTAGPSGMGAATVAAAVIDTRLVVAHLGDARGYLFRAADVTQLTVDHSWVQEQVSSRRLTPEEAHAHPYRHVITRALGVDDSGMPDVTTTTVMPGDIILLCSDGLSDVATDGDLAGAIAAPNAQAAARALVDLAIARGGQDNISVIVIRVVAMGPRVPTIQLPARRSQV